MLIIFSVYGCSDYYEYSYYNNDSEYHRLGGPSYINKSGSKWYKNGNLHREDGPAEENRNGFKSFYWLNGAYYNKQRYLEIIRFGAFV